VPGARVIALDFDRFLQDVAGGTTRVLAHFGLAHDRDALAAILQSGVLQQYSKAPDLPYPPGERTARLAESRRDNRAEIASGLAWLDRMARADGSVAAIVGAGAA